MIAELPVHLLLPEKERLASSFRDPQGFVFNARGKIFRCIEHSYKPHYEKLMSSGLYEELCNAGLLVRHQEVADEQALPWRKSSISPFKIIAPEKIPFISYPYEWCFSQLKDAALLTLEVAVRALRRGMILKDASAYNVQFRGARPILIDTLSFEIYTEGNAWIAYRQFCEHFLAPLTLMSKGDLRANKLLQSFIDGLPLDMTCKLLPWSTALKPSLFIHLYMHAAAQKQHAGKSLKDLHDKKMPKQSLFALLDNLVDCIKSTNLQDTKTTWSDYYSDNNYSDKSISVKEELLKEFINKTTATEIWDIGANTGNFSRSAESMGKRVVSMDMDAMCVEMNYRRCKDEQRQILPLLVDLSAPSPAIGWNNRERMSLSERGPAQLGLALALIHHLAIGNNVPLPMVADYFAGICDKLIIEFVPKEDSQVQRMLASREDIFTDYNEENFRKEFGRHFEVLAVSRIEDTERSLYLLKRRHSH